MLYQLYHLFILLLEDLAHGIVLYALQIHITVINIDYRLRGAPHKVERLMIGYAAHPSCQRGLLRIVRLDIAENLDKHILINFLSILLAGDDSGHLTKNHLTILLKQIALGLLFLSAKALYEFVCRFIHHVCVACHSYIHGKAENIAAKFKKKDDSYDFSQTLRSPETYKSKFYYKRGDVTTIPDLSVASLLPLASTDDIAKLGREFLADAFLAFTYGGCGGVTEVGKDGIGVAEEYTQCADEFLVVEVTIVE